MPVYVITKNDEPFVVIVDVIEASNAYAALEDYGVAPRRYARDDGATFAESSEFYVPESTNFGGSRGSVRPRYLARDLNERMKRLIQAGTYTMGPNMNDEEVLFLYRAGFHERYRQFVSLGRGELIS